MGKHHPNHRLVKINRSYTLEETASVLDVHKNTVREWIRTGLPTIGDKRPILILGRELIAFLLARRQKNKQTCRPGEIYCVRCHAPKFPAGGMADYVPDTEMVGNLVAICPDCGSIMNRRVSRARLGQVRGEIDITFPEGLRQLGEISQPTVNSDLR
jgi:hypothetical protein